MKVGENSYMFVGLAVVVVAQFGFFFVSFIFDLIYILCCYESNFFKWVVYIILFFEYCGFIILNIVYCVVIAVTWKVDYNMMKYAYENKCSDGPLQNAFE